MGHMALKIDQWTLRSRLKSGSNNVIGRPPHRQNVSYETLILILLPIGLATATQVSLFELSWYVGRWWLFSKIFHDICGNERHELR